MGIFRHDILLIGANGQSRTLNGMVDTGALYSVFPRSILLELGARPSSRMGVEFANGEFDHWDLGSVEAEMFGKRLPIIAFFGPDDRVLIGAHTLETFAVDVDVVKKILVPKEFAPMMGFDLV